MRFRELLLFLMLVAGLSLAVSAQRDKPPPKDPKETPKVEPRGEKPPPRPNPTPKKPGSEYSLVWRDEKGFLA